MNPTDAPAVDPRTRPADVVAALGLQEKVNLLSGRGFWTLEPVPSHDLDGVVVSDGPHGLRCQVGEADHLGIAAASPATCFPTAATLGSTWDVELLVEVGAALGAEARHQGVGVLLGPGLNLKRHPAGGRSFEYLSEDPLLSGRLAAAIVRGVQSRGVGTSIKHFAVNNQESHRLVVDAVVDERTLRELYLSGFEIAVKESRPWTVMCAYNLVNGTYASEHRELLTSILRDEWGFDGLVVSDWGAVSDRVAGVDAGLDLEMPSSRGALDAEVLDAVRDGRLGEAAVDRCAERVVELLRRAQRAGPPPPVDLDDHHDLARRAAAAGTVLLSNNGALPLSTSCRVAVVGAFAVEPRYQGAGSSQVTPTHLDRALDVLTDRVGDAGEVVYAPGYDARTGATTDELLDGALATSSSADVVVLFAGLPAAMESEGFDRSTLDLPDGQLRLIEALAAGPAPVVVVLNNGGVVHLPWADRVDALLECWLGGQAGGTAAVDVLVGDAEPGGRLAESVPVHVTQLPADRNFPGSARQVQYREGFHVGYRFHDTAGVPARFPFGAGGSYTTFDWNDIGAEGDGTEVAVGVTVTNTGDRPGSDVVQVYVRDVACTVHRPDKELKGFAKVHLDPGASQRVTIVLDRRSFAVWDVGVHDWLVEPGAFELVVARSSVDVEATLVHRIIDGDELTPTPAPTGVVATGEEFVELLGGALPEVPAARPFHRNSTLEDLGETQVGRLLASRVVAEAVRRSAAEFPDPDDATLEMIRSSVREGPLRMLALMSDGMVPMSAVDMTISALNGEWARTLRSVGSAAARVARRASSSPGGQS